jgi:phosphoglycolate phosphatase
VKPVRLVVFDLDGTLVDSSRDLATAVNRTLAASGVPALDPALVRSFVGEGARRLIEKSVAAAGQPLSVDALLPVFLDIYREVLLETTRLYPGVPETLAALVPRKLAVLTNKPGDMSRAILSGLGIAHRFDWIWGYGDVPARKPDPVGLVRLMAAAAVPPEDTAFVGDSAIDVRTARAAGARAIGVTYGFDPRAFDEHVPDARVTDPRELPELLSR